LVVAGVNHGYKVSAAGKFTPSDRSSQSPVIYDGPADRFLKVPAIQGATEFGGTSWQLVKFQGGNDETLRPDDKAKYTIAFATNGRVTARIDCNRGMGTWKSSGRNQIQFGPMALTRAMCPPGSLHDQIAKNWRFVRSYIIKDGHLFLSLMADGGVYEFEPIGNSQPETSLLGSD
jgi:heat shock protein HslJ